MANEDYKSDKQQGLLYGPISRRDLLKLGAATAGGLAIASSLPHYFQALAQEQQPAISTPNITLEPGPLRSPAGLRTAVSGKTIRPQYDIRTLEGRMAIFPASQQGTIRFPRDLFTDLYDENRGMSRRYIVPNNEVKVFVHGFDLDRDARIYTELLSGAPTDNQHGGDLQELADHTGLTFIVGYVPGQMGPAIGMRLRTDEPNTLSVWYNFRGEGSFSRLQDPDTIGLHNVYPENSPTITGGNLTFMKGIQNGLMLPIVQNELTEQLLGVDETNLQREHRDTIFGRRVTVGDRRTQTDKNLIAGVYSADRPSNISTIASLEGIQLV